MNSLKYKLELALVKAQNIDITNFETQLDTFKTAFAKTTTSPPGDFRQQSMKLTSRSTTYRRRRRPCLAPTGIFDLRTTRRRTTIKKLTRGNPTMAAKFAELKDGGSSDAE